jgi:hypothetical protein
MMRFVLFNKRRELLSLHEYLASVPVMMRFVLFNKRRELLSLHEHLASVLVMMRLVLFNKRRELLSLHEHLASVPVMMRFVLLILLAFCVVFSFACLSSCLVYPMLPVSLDCPFLITPSVFCNVY